MNCHKVKHPYNITQVKKENISSSLEAPPKYYSITFKGTFYKAYLETFNTCSCETITRNSYQSCDY